MELQGILSRRNGDGDAADGQLEAEVLHGYISLADGMRRSGDVKGAISSYMEVLELLVAGFMEKKAENEEQKLETEKVDTTTEREILSQMHQFCDEIVGPLLNEVYTPHKVHPQTIDEIRALCASVLQARSTILGLLHDDSIASRRSLVGLLYATGQWTDAIQLGRAYLGSIDSEPSLSGRPETKKLLATMLSFYDQPQKEEALRLLQEVLQSQSLNSGPVQTRMVDNTLLIVDLLEQLDRREEALPIIDAWIADAEAALGSTHRLVLLCKLRRGLLLVKLGRDEVRSILDDAKEQLREEGTTSNRPALLAKLARARLLVALEEVDEAEAAFEDLVELVSQTLPEGHPDALKVHEEHASFLQSLGEVEQALGVREQISTCLRNSLGQKHPLMLRALFEQASCLGALGRFTDARSLLEDVADGYGQVLGRKNGRFIEVLQALSLVLVQLGELIRARKVQEQVVDVLTGKHGLNDERTIAATLTLASVIWSSGMETEALAMETRAMNLQREVLGEKHPTTLQTMHNHAVTLQSIGRYSNSLVLLQEVYAARKEVLGEGHAHTLATHFSLAISQEGLGRNKEAVETVQAVVALAEKSLELGEVTEEEIEEYRVALTEMRKEVELFEKKFGSLQ